MLKISESLHLPAEVVTETVAILAKKNAGKTYTGSVLAEEMLGMGAHLVWIDPVGVAWGLRTNAASNGEGFPLLILGGSRGDLPLDPAAGAAIAALVVKESVSCILDLSLLTMPLISQFLAAFLTEVYRLKGECRTPLHLIIDEADIVAPQRVNSSGESATLFALDTIVRRGRSRGLGTTVITQRPAVLSKNILTQIEVLIVHRLMAPIDKKAIDEWIESHGTPEQRKLVAESLATLAVGEAWIWAPNLTGALTRVKIRRRTTFDSSSTPKVGQREETPRTLATIDLTALRERLTAALSQAMENDPETLRRQVADLKEQLAARPVETKTVTVERVVEVPVLPENAQEQIRGWMDSAVATAKDLQSTAGELMRCWEQMKQMLDRFPTTAPHPAPLSVGVTSTTGSATEEEPPVIRYMTDQKPQVPGTAYPAGAFRILSALSAGLRLTTSQLGVHAKLSMSGGTASSYVSQLKGDGLITFDGNYYTITDRGLKALGKTRPDPPKTTEEILALWKKGLSNRAYDMLEILVAARRAGKGLTADVLAQKMGISASGGAFGSYRSELTQNELASRSGALLTASDALFPDGLKS